jgi:hypothetical protein
VSSTGTPLDFSSRLYYYRAKTCFPCTGFTDYRLSVIGRQTPVTDYRSQITKNRRQTTTTALAPKGRANHVSPMNTPHTISHRLRRLCPAAAVTALCLATVHAEDPPMIAFTNSITIQAEAAVLDHDRVRVVNRESLGGGKGVSLRPECPSRVGEADAAPDLSVTVKAATAGRYLIRTHAATDERGAELMRKARSKHESMFLTIAVGDRKPTKRVVFVPWSRPDSCTQTLGKFNLADNAQTISVWLPEGLQLDTIAISPYRPPAVPAAVQAYEPTVVPPASRPRIWLNAESLPRIRARLVCVQRRTGSRDRIQSRPGKGRRAQGLRLSNDRR